MNEIETDEKSQEVDYLSLSDDDFEKAATPAFVDAVEEETEESNTEDTEEVEEEKTEEEESEETEEKEPEETENSEEEPESEDKETDSEPKEKSEKEDEEKTDDSSQETFDYKAEYEKLMAPFKANGREVTPKNPEDATRLMQMGANYHKKMAAMKPAMKALKTLENNGLLEDGKLDFLIDVHNGNSDAITKLIKDSKIDPLEVDTETDSTYQPTNHSVSDEELELDSVLEGIQESPSYSKTLTTVTKEWDQDSRTQVASNPHIISIINQHMDNGIYDQVMDVVNYDRSIGKLTGVSDLEAYKLTGNKLEQEGAFNKPVNSQNTETKKPINPVNPKVEQKRKAQKKAASPTKTSKKVNKVSADFNPLNMSDEEFEKFDPKLIGL